MAIQKQTYTVDVSERQLKNYRENPAMLVDNIIDKCRSVILPDSKSPYLFVSDLELILGRKYVDELGIEDYVIRRNQNWNGNSQMRRLLSVAHFRKLVLEADVEETKASEALADLPANTPINIKAKGCKMEEIDPTTIYGTAKITVGGLKGTLDGISVIVTKDQKAASRTKGVPTTVAQLRAAVQPIVDAKYAVKSQRIADLCMAYSNQLIEEQNLTAEQIKQNDRFVYREPRRLLYREFERIFAEDETVAKFVASREALTGEDTETYIKGVYAIGYIDWLLEIAEVLFEPFLAQA